MWSEELQEEMEELEERRTSRSGGLVWETSECDQAPEEAEQSWLTGLEWPGRPPALPRHS